MSGPGASARQAREESMARLRGLLGHDWPERGEKERLREKAGHTGRPGRAGLLGPNSREGEKKK